MLLSLENEACRLATDPCLSLNTFLRGLVWNGAGEMAIRAREFSWPLPTILVAKLAISALWSGLMEPLEEDGDEPLLRLWNFLCWWANYLELSVSWGELFIMKWMSFCLASSGLESRVFWVKTPFMGAHTGLLDFLGDLNVLVLILCLFSMVSIFTSEITSSLFEGKTSGSTESLFLARIPFSRSLNDFYG